MQVIYRRICQRNREMFIWNLEYKNEDWCEMTLRNLKSIGTGESWKILLRGWDDASLRWLYGR